MIIIWRAFLRGIGYTIARDLVNVIFRSLR